MPQIGPNVQPSPMARVGVALEQERRQDIRQREQQDFAEEMQDRQQKMEFTRLGAQQRRLQMQMDQQRQLAVFNQARQDARFATQRDFDLAKWQVETKIDIEGMRAKSQEAGRDFAKEQAEMAVKYGIKWNPEAAEGRGAYEPMTTEEGQAIGGTEQVKARAELLRAEATLTDAQRRIMAPLMEAEADRMKSARSMQMVRAVHPEWMAGEGNGKAIQALAESDLTENQIMGVAEDMINQERVAAQTDILFDPEATPEAKQRARMDLAELDSALGSAAKDILSGDQAGGVTKIKMNAYQQSARGLQSTMKDTAKQIDTLTAAIGKTPDATAQDEIRQRIEEIRPQMTAARQRLRSLATTGAVTATAFTGPLKIRGWTSRKSTAQLMSEARGMKDIEGEALELWKTDMKDRFGEDVSIQEMVQLHEKAIELRELYHVDRQEWLTLATIDMDDPMRFLWGAAGEPTRPEPTAKPTRKGQRRKDHMKLRIPRKGEKRQIVARTQSIYGALQDTRRELATARQGGDWQAILKIRDREASLRYDLRQQQGGRTEQLPEELEVF